MPGFGSSGDSFKKKPIFSFGINDKKEVNNNEEGMRTDRRKMSGGILGSGDSHARTHLPLQKSRTEPSLVVDWENIDSRYTKIGRNGYRQKHFVEQFKQLSMNGVDYSPEIRRNGRETSHTTTDRTGGSVTVKNVSENSGNGERCESMSNKTKKSESLGKGAGNSVVCDTDTYAGRRDVSDPASVLEKQIVSSRGTVRGFKNRVRAGIATFLQHQEGNIQESEEYGSETRNYRILEKGKIIIYTTSMTVIRRSNERCKKVKKILQNHMVRYEERDMFMSKENQKELAERLGNHNAVLPQVFADGSPLGSLEQLEKMNESGELRHLLKNFTKIDVKSSCDKCGGYRFIPCVHCHGSKKSLRRNNFTDEFCALRCMQCDENGLQRCDLCLDQQE